MTQIHEFGPFRLDATERILLRGYDLVPLTPKLFALLLVLVENNGRVVSKDELMRQVWPDSFVEEGNLTQSISLLRKALGETVNGKPYIETIPRRGYRFVTGVIKSPAGEVASASSGSQVTVGKGVDQNANDEMSAGPNLALRQSAPDAPVIGVNSDIAAGDDGAVTTSMMAAAAGTSSFSTTTVAGQISLPNSRPARDATTAPLARLWSPIRNRLIVLAAVASMLGVALSAFYYLFRDNRTVEYVAVLSFSNDSADDNTKFLNDGLVVTLINNLAQVPKLRVVPRPVVSDYNGRSDLQKLKDIDVRIVVTGIIRRHGDSVSVEADLIDLENDSHNSQPWAWKSQLYSINDLVRAHDETSREICKEISKRQLPKLNGEERERLEANGLYRGNYVSDSNDEIEEKEQLQANDLYLHARNALNKRTPESLEEARDYFDRAIRKDPNYALAYAGLADCYNLLAVYGIRKPKDAFPEAQKAARKALELDKDLAEAHTSLGLIKHRFEWNQQDAEQEFELAIKRKPNYASAHQWYSSYLISVGRRDEAIAEARHAARLDPLSFSARIHLAWILYMTGHYKEAIARCDEILAVNKSFFPAYRYLGLSYEQEGEYEKAIEAFTLGKNLSDTPLMAALLGHAYAVAGKHKKARKVLEGLQKISSKQYVSPYTMAAIYAGLRDNDRAFDLLERAVEERDIWLMNLCTDPVFKEQRADPRFKARFKAILVRIGLADCG